MDINESINCERISNRTNLGGVEDGAVLVDLVRLAHVVEAHFHRRALDVGYPVVVLHRLHELVRVERLRDNLRNPEHDQIFQVPRNRHQTGRK